jgi:hypothetical protein
MFSKFIQSRRGISLILGMLSEVIAWKNNLRVPEFSETWNPQLRTTWAEPLDGTYVLWMEPAARGAVEYKQRILPA